MTEYFGLYRGKVKSNVDTSKKGKLLVTVSGVIGEPGDWAMPSVPFAGPMMGFFAIPPMGANVWVQFEGGDPTKPIWTGCFWDDLQSAPISAPTDAAQKIVLKTLLGAITLYQIPGTGGEIITIEALPAFKIEIKGVPPTVEITNGVASITLQGPQVSINQGALEVI
jgi:hypothetical protein